MVDRKLSTQEALLLLLDLQDGMKNRSQHLSNRYTLNRTPPNYLNSHGSSVKKVHITEDIYGAKYESIDFWTKEMVSLLSEGEQTHHSKQKYLIK
jgi:hypothetical protein